MMENESIKTKVAVISKDISYIQKDIADIKEAIKTLANLALQTKELQETAKQTEIRLVKLENSNNMWKWLSPSMAAILAVVVEYLFINYLQHLK